MLSFISCSNLNYSFADGVELFNGLNCSIGHEKVGLIGPNGVGKTTLLKLLQGELEPTSGSVHLRGSLGVISQRSFTKQDETVGYVMGLTQDYPEQWELQDELSSIKKELNIDHLPLSRSLDALSGGEFVKVHLARILMNPPAIVILDEPTNNLDSEGRAVLYDFVERWDQCLLVVSHDRELLSRMDAILELTNRGLQKYGGNYEFYLNQRNLEEAAIEQRIVTADQRLRKEKHELQRSLERQSKRMIRGQKNSGKGGVPKIVAGGLKRRAQNTMARSKGVHEDRVERARDELQFANAMIKERNLIKVDIPETNVHRGKVIFEIKEINFRFFDSETPLFADPINFTLAGPRRVAISGGNGEGKSTLINLLLDSGGLSNCPLRGECVGSISLKIGRVSYLDQHVDILNDRLTLLENFSRGTLHLSESERRIRLGRFLFKGSTVGHYASSLSGGERLRAGLACILYSEVPPQLLILDEPTNNLDLDSIERIESALSNFQGAMLIVSHDKQFLRNIGVEQEIVLRKAR